MNLIFFPPQVHGIVQDRNGKTVATLFGKWDESIHYVIGECSGKGKELESLSEACLLWKRSKPPKYPTRYNFTRFAITLNEVTPGLKVIILTASLHFSYMHALSLTYLHGTFILFACMFCMAHVLELV